MTTPSGTFVGIDVSKAQCDVAVRPACEHWTSAQTDAGIKRVIWELRVRKRDCCEQKIASCLEREYPVWLSLPKIYEILAEKYVIRSKGRKNQKRGAVPTASRARAVIQMDTVAYGHLFAFTGVDMYTKEAEVMLGPP